jgi:RNA polymerase sigma-70 factor (ECF subfamily)
VKDPSSDEALMDLAQRGDTRAYTTLFERHRAPLYGYVLRMVGRPELADELFQETFLSVHRARATWSSHEGSFRSWLFRIATNAVRDRARQAARRPEVMGDAFELSGAPDQTDAVALEELLRALPEPLREAFLLGAVLGMDHNEIAQALAITPDNARARLSRARARLRELLEAS